MELLSFEDKPTSLRLEHGGRRDHDSLSTDLERQDEFVVQIPEQPHVTNGHRSIAFLDGLRGLAAFLVYLFHHISWFYGPEDPIQHGYGYKGEKYFASLPFVRIFFTGGNAAVAVFFVLSGYVLSRSPLAMLRKGHVHDLYRSLLFATVRRPFRLFIPPLGVSSVVALIMHLPLGLAPQFSWPEAKTTLWHELQNFQSTFWSAINPFQEHGPFTAWFPYNPPIWTLPVELKGSVLVFILIAMSSVAKPEYRRLIFLITGVVCLLSYQWAMACFLGGVLLAINDQEASDNKIVFSKVSLGTQHIAYHFLFILGWYILCQPAGVCDPALSLQTPGWYYLTLLIPPNYYSAEYWRFYNTLGAVIFIYAILRIPWLQSFFSKPSLRYLGRISFSFYLTHMPFLWIVGDRIDRLVGHVRPGLVTWYDNQIPVRDVGPRGMGTAFILTQMFILPGNLLVAEVATLVLDRPSIKVGKWLVAWAWGKYWGAQTGGESEHGSEIRNRNEAATSKGWEPGR